MSETEPIQEVKVSIFNRGIRIFKLPGGIVIPPGRTVDVPESIAKKYTGPNGYRELVDASTMSPVTKKRVEALEGENAQLKARIAELEAGKIAAPAAPSDGVPADATKAEVPAAPPVEAPKPPVDAPAATKPSAPKAPKPGK